ncbi:MAG: DNA pilot protein [Microviridae sp.]|nr:MAG: DNA pilot protein [Microviridae sp.]
MPALAGPIIAAAASALSTGGQLYANAKMNKKAIKYNREAYARQRADALADYHMQNEYNSPAAQMARFKEAGLNPNLIYGSGNGTEASPIRNSEMQSFQGDVPNFSNAGGQMVADYLTTKMNAQQLDNLKKQNDVLTAEAQLKAAQTINTLTGTEVSKFNLSRDTATLAYDIDAKKQAVNKLLQDILHGQASTTATSDANTRANQLQAGTVKQQAATLAATELQNAKTQSERDEILEKIKLLKQSQDMNKFELDLNKKGFTRSDDVKYRLGAKIWDAMTNGMSIKQAIDKVSKELTAPTHGGKNTSHEYKKAGFGFFPKK